MAGSPGSCLPLQGLFALGQCPLPLQCQLEPSAPHTHARLSQAKSLHPMKRVCASAGAGQRRAAPATSPPGGHSAEGVPLLFNGAPCSQRAECVGVKSTSKAASGSL